MFQKASATLNIQSISLQFYILFSTHQKKKSYLFTTKKTLSMIIPLESALVITEIVQLSEMVKGALKSVQRGKNHDLDESSKGYA